MTGPRFVPFESMSDAEQREHLRRMHGVTPEQVTHLRNVRWIHATDHQADRPLGVQPHTHDKPAPRPEENR